MMLELRNGERVINVENIGDEVIEQGIDEENTKAEYYEKPLKPTVGPNGVDAHNLEESLGADLTKAISILDSCGSTTYLSMKKWFVRPDPFLESKLVGIFAKFRSLDNAFQVLDERCMGNLRAWLAMIGVFSRFLNDLDIKQIMKVEKFCEVSQISPEYIRVSGLATLSGEAEIMKMLALVCDSKGDFENALAHSGITTMAIAANGQNADVATIDCNIGDASLSLLRYDKSIHAFLKALNTFKSSKGESHPLVVSIFVHLDDLCNRIKKFINSKSYCENALRIYLKPASRSQPELIVSGLGKSDALVLEIAGAIALGFSNIFVTAPV